METYGIETTSTDLPPCPKCDGEDLDFIIRDNLGILSDIGTETLICCDCDFKFKIEYGRTTTYFYNTIQEVKE